MTAIDLGTMKPIKKQLSYSPLTSKVYWVDGKSQKTDVTKSFEAILAMMVEDMDFEKGWRWSFDKLGFAVELKKTKLEEEDNNERQRNSENGENQIL